MRKAWSLTKVYINSIYGIKGFINELKTGKRPAAKLIGVIALIIILLMSFAPMIVGYNFLLYTALKPIGQQGVMITNAVITATMFTVILGLVSIVATYFVDKERDIVLSMPIRPWNLLVAKFAVNYLSEFMISALIILPSVIIYGVKEGMGVLNYVSTVIILFFVPLIPMVLCYFIVIPLMKVANFLKKKDTLMILSGIMGLGLAVIIQIFSSQMVKFEKTPQMMAEMITGPNSLVSIVGRTYYPSIMATKGILEINSLSGVINAVLFLGISVLLVLLLLYTMSNFYFNSNIGIDEVKKSTKKYSESDFKSGLRKKTILSSLTLREIKLMNREPVYLLNGPMVIVLMPLIMGLMMYIQRDQMGELFGIISKASGATYYVTIAVAGIGMFLGITGTPSSSAISREGRAFMTIKAMPIRPKEYMDAKLLHSILIGIIASLVSCIMGYAFVRLPLINCLIAFVISNLLMLPIFLAGLIIELKWPRLLWDNPVKAMKQNINVLVVVLGEMFILLPILALLVIFVLKNNSILSYIVLAAVPGITSIVLYNFLIKYAQKRFYDIEI